MTSTLASWEAVMQAEDRRTQPNQRRSTLRDRLMLRVREAAEALGMCEDSFVRHVAPEVAMVRRGKLRLVPVKELERWIDENSVRVRCDR